MKKRMHLKKKRKKANYFLLFLIIILTLFVFVFIKFKNIEPLIISYSEMESNKLATLIINAAIKEENILVNDNLYKVENNMINYDTKQLNSALVSLTSRIQKYFNAIENGRVTEIEKSILEEYNYNLLKKGAVIYLPMGYLSGSPFLASIGPKIPLKITLIGDVKTDIKERVINYGLNNAILKIYIYVEVITKSTIPFISNTQKTIVEYPLVLKMIEGKIPSFYLENR